MSDDTDPQLKGFVEYLVMMSDMIERAKIISDKYDFDSNKMKEQDTFENILAYADPSVVGLIVTTIMKFRIFLDKPLENLDKIDPEKFQEFKENILKLKESVIGSN